MQRGVLALAAVAALWTMPALAQTATVPQDVFLTTQGEGQYLAKDLLLGAKVHNAEGQIVGDVEDLILNADNQVEGVIMGVGGFAGWGEKRVGVALSALQIKNENGVVTVSLPQATKETLDALTAFERKQPPKSLLDRAIEKAKELSDKGSVTAKEAYEKAKEEAGPALEKAQGGGEEDLRGEREAGAREGGRGDEGGLRRRQGGDGDEAGRDACTGPRDDAARRGTRHASGRDAEGSPSRAALRVSVSVIPEAANVMAKPCSAWT
ncbi:MAG: PRC-barrel domain-containing protein [Hyphomicrobium sp.]|nr:PRC-barrel domain-containing protein [Hyphomicrobium sp.]